MIRRKMGQTGKTFSTFGFGCMRLPLLRKEDGTTSYGVVDEPEAIRMIHRAIEEGVDYFDTAFFYHEGNSELILGRALAGGLRDKVSIATKMPLSRAEKLEDFDAVLDQQLTRLQTDHIDFYLLHGINLTSFEKAKQIGVYQFLEQAKADGRIRHIGFSFHDRLDSFKAIVADYDWEFCQIQLNILDEFYQAGVEGLRLAAAKGMGVIIMEPLRGGALANHIPPAVSAVYARDPKRRTPVEWAFRWLLEFPEVSLILSGVSTMEQLEDNLRIFSTEDQPLNQADRALLDEVKRTYRELTQIHCTSCRYCVPCPSGVAIPKVFSTWNYAYQFDNLPDARRGYAELIKGNKDASQCVMCGQCETKCPQQLSIMDGLSRAHAVLTAED